MDPQLKTFLESRRFPELLAKYKEDHIVLTVTGLNAYRVMTRNYEMQPGFRCQVFASASKESALKVAAQLRELVADSVYIIEDKPLYKVQVGDYQKRTTAEETMLMLQRSGFPGTWIVETEVRVAKSAEAKQQIAAKQSELADKFNAEMGYSYAIQIMATANKQNAEDLAARLRGEILQPVAVVSHRGIWKVLVGRFKNRQEAEYLLTQLKSNGYFDAWITQLLDE
jgi:hypothetical protein